MPSLPFDVVHRLPGWALYWALLEPTDPVDQLPARLDSLRRRTAERARERYRLETLAGRPAVAALRKLFRAAGTDPTRHRPSSEALLRRLLKGGELPAIHPLVDFNNCLSVELPAPCCVMNEHALEPPFVLRAGTSGESYDSFKGPFRLEGRPLLVDALGPCDALITGSERVKVARDTGRAWLVAYLPASAITPAETAQRVAQLLEAAPVATVLSEGASGESAGDS
ncbi:MAG: hypothetical protein GY769_07220 [bacterium]|nr:hypothetical protein [bacterium]